MRQHHSDSVLIYTVDFYSRYKNPLTYRKPKSGTI